MAFVNAWVSLFYLRIVRASRQMSEAEIEDPALIDIHCARPSWNNSIFGSEITKLAICSLCYDLRSICFGGDLHHCVKIVSIIFQS